MDEPFSALDVLTAENLRSEVLRLWLDHKVDIKTVLFVSHDIREAVFLANRIVVLGTHPGTIRIILKNDLSHPRDPRSPEFQALIDKIHDIITNAILPNEDPERLFTTLVRWGRYGGLLGYSAKDDIIYLRQERLTSGT